LKRILLGAAYLCGSITCIVSPAASNDIDSDLVIGARVVEPCAISLNMENPDWNDRANSDVVCTIDRRLKVRTVRVPNADLTAGNISVVKSSSYDHLNGDGFIVTEISF